MIAVIGVVINRRSSAARLDVLEENMTSDAKGVRLPLSDHDNNVDDEGSRGKLLVQRYSPSEFIHNACTAVANAAQEPGGYNINLP